MEDRASAVKDLIARLAGDQPFGVLCTQAGGQPYGSLVAFAVLDDLSAYVFATPRQTAKYRFLRECPQVALVVDSRAAHAEDPGRIEAFTAVGRAREVVDHEERGPLKQLLIARHPAQRSMIEASDSALFVIRVERYLHVVRFQEVREWTPPPGGSWPK